MDAGLELRELDAYEFLANLDACTNVYAAAMDPPEYQLPGRHTIMERHAGFAGFRAVAALRRVHAPTPDAALRPGTTANAAGPNAAAPPGTTAEGLIPGPLTRDGLTSGPLTRDELTQGGLTVNGFSSNGQLVLAGFAYGFHGENGQWWHDLVAQAVRGTLGHQAASDWLSDCLEIAEVHVHPGYQGRGTGLAMLLRLTHGRPERTALLSTMDANTRARRLYRGLGFTDLLTNFAFAGTQDPYAIMGAPLPLPGASSRPDRPSRS